ncbi:hypothetical protein PHYPSEUDO_000325 [Phytophthora pseudosyringae]|uniref:Uncharacterized protein n=1 Tax=Phytophthora pseudosyringae TaxID=221518 RepID=A0A8T1VZM9_9STRA|nr:hypothetical protein PHYPSEUDO_000325 [Phytophthora pseudosyringae]
MSSRLQRVAALLFVCVSWRAPRVAAHESASSAKLLHGPSAGPVSPLGVGAWSAGSVAAGCSLCRDSGNCSVAMNDTSSGVFCGDLHAAANTQPCCCPYYTECQVASKSKTCKCRGPWPIITRHERLSVTEPANEAETLIQDSFTPETNDAMDNQMAVSTEILIHLSAYLALFVFAVYVDQWVECFSDFRRNQMVVYGEAVDTKLLRFRQRFGKRRRDSQTDTETEDNLPLLVLESPVPTSRPVFTFEEIPDTEEDTPVVLDVEEKASVSEEVVVVTVPVVVVPEVSTSPPTPPVELEEIPIE